MGYNVPIDNHTREEPPLMSRRLNDGEAFEILNGRVKRLGRRVRVNLAALQWAADRAGKSYGVFTQGLSPI